jgi:hypothetical protein
MLGIIRIAALVLAMAAFASSLLAQNKIADLQARLAHEPNPVSKAKIMPQLGDLEFAEMDADVNQGRLTEALALLSAYREEVISCDKALDALGIDADKHPNGFKQLQFSLRDSLRRLDIVIVSMTTDEQPPFLEIRKELRELDRHLIEQLFPHQDQAKPQS